MICSSREVPKVATARAWVSPRVNSATVRARQYAGLDVQRTDGAGVAVVDARLSVQNLAADDIGFQAFENTFDFVGCQRVGFFGNQGFFTAFQASSNLAERACF